MKAVIYTRVSSADQVKEGYSLPEQEIFCRKFAEKEGYDVIKVFVESGESAKTSNRTQLKKAIEYCIKNKNSVDALIIKRLDRFARNLEDQIELVKQFKKYGVKVLSATETNEDTATGKLMRNIIGSFSQYENDIKSERVTAGMKQAFSEGKWQWRPPKGYIKDYPNRSIMPDPKTAHLVKKAFELFSTGNYEQVQIISILKKDGLSLKANHLCRMFKNQLYCGYMVKKEWFEEPIKGSFEPLVSEKIFYQVRDILEGRKPQITAYKRNNPLFPLRLFVTCPNCNQPLTGSQSRGRKDKKYPYYHCYNKDCNINFRIPKDRLENKFVSYLKRIRPNNDILSLFKAVVADVYNTNIHEQAKYITSLNSKLEELKGTKGRLIDLYVEGKINEDDYKFKSDSLQINEQSLKAELITSELPRDDFDNCLEYACKWISRVDKFWLESDLNTKQRVQKMIFPKGITYDTDKFRTTEKSCLFTIIGALSAPTIKMVLPGEFESH